MARKEAKAARVAKKEAEAATARQEWISRKDDLIKTAAALGARLRKIDRDHTGDKGDKKKKKLEGEKRKLLSNQVRLHKHYLLNPEKVPLTRKDDATGKRAPVELAVLKAGVERLINQAKARDYAPLEGKAAKMKVADLPGDLTDEESARRAKAKADAQVAATQIIADRRAAAEAKEQEATKRTEEKHAAANAKAEAKEEERKRREEQQRLAKEKATADKEAAKAARKREAADRKEAHDKVKALVAGCQVRAPKSDDGEPATGFVIYEPHKDRTLLVVDKYEVTIRYFKVPEDYAKINRNTNLWREKIVATVEYDTSRDEISTVDLLKEVTEWSGRDGS